MRRDVVRVEEADTVAREAPGDAHWQRGIDPRRAPEDPQRHAERIDKATRYRDFRPFLLTPAHHPP